MKSSQIIRMISLIVFLLVANSCATNHTLVQSPQPDTPAQVAKVSIIQRILFIEEENYTRIRIEGSESIAPPFYKLLSDPLRIAIDLPNIDLREIKEPIKIDNGTINEILTTQYDDKGRIEIGLAQAANYNITKEDKNLIIDVEKVKRVVEVVDSTLRAEEVKKEEGPDKEKEIEVSPTEIKKEEGLPIVPVVTASPPGAMHKAKEIISFLFETKGDFITLNIIADGKIENYNSFKLDSPARLVLDIWEVDTRYPQRSIKIKNPFIKEARIGHHPGKLRLVFDSQKPLLPPYQINRIDDRLIVSIGNVPQPSEPQILVQEKPTEGISPRGGGVKEGSAEPPKPQLKTSPASEGLKKNRPSSLTEIDFKQMDNKSRIVVALTEEPKFESRTISKKLIAVDIKNASVPKHLQRGLDTSKFESAVNSINLKNIKIGKTQDVRILIKLREEVPFETTSEGKLLFVDIEKLKKVEAKIEAAAVPPKEEVTLETKKEEVAKEELKKEEEKFIPEVKKEEKVLSPGEEKQTPLQQVTKTAVEEKKAIEEPPPGMTFKGRKLSLDFKDADVKNILRLIAEVSNLNIIAGEEVTGKITMRLVDVPWDQALDLILQARSLGMIRAGNVIRIAPIDKLKKEVEEELVAKRAKEKLEDLMTELIPVNYATAKELSPQVKSVLSDRGDVKADDRTNILIVKDIPKNIVGVKNLVKFLDMKTPQVLIEARIIEANLTFQNELGVSWGFLASTGTDKKKTGTVGGGTTGTSTVSPTTVTNKVVDLPANPQGGAGGIGTAGVLEFLFTSKYGLKQLDIAISAHENKGDVRIISSPKIAALDNKEASIEQGLRIPIPKVDPQSGQISIDYVEANLRLTVTPHVTNDGNIKMNIKVKKDAADWSKTVNSVPSIDKKEADTEVMVKDTGIVVIAGVYSIEKDNGDEGVPLFNKIPLLGWLFKKEVKQDLRKDLLIFISPKIIRDEV